MDSLISSNISSSNTSSDTFTATIQKANAKYSAESAIIENISKDSDSATKVSTSFNKLSNCLTVEAKEILKAINKELGDFLPEGVESVNEEDATSEATADRIVSGVTAMFSNYMKSNSNMDTEEMLSSFMNAARKGVSTGYDEAFKILDGLGAFGYDGVQSGIEKTMELVTQKLDEFESSMKEQLGIVTKESETEA